MNWMNRYRHRLMLPMQVWPMNPRTMKAGLEKTEFEIDGMTFTHNARLAVTSRFGEGKSDFYVWELGKADGDLLSTVGAADAKIMTMTVKTPGTLNETVKKECWLEVNVVVYPNELAEPSWSREVFPTGEESDVKARIEAIWARDFEHMKHQMRVKHQYNKKAYEQWLEDAEEYKRTFKGVHYILHKEMIDYPLLARKIMEGYVVLIDMRLKAFGRVAIARIQENLAYYFDKSIPADEPGGMFKGYCLGHSVFWCKDIALPQEVLEQGDAAVKAYKIEAKKEKRRAKVRAHFIEGVTTRVAAYYGVSRELVMRRFLEVGFNDWLADEADKAAMDESRMHLYGIDAQIKNFVCEAAKVLEFCIDATAVRPPDPVPPVLTTKQREAKEEYQRKKIDEFNAMSPEEQAKVLARKASRERGTPQGLLKEIVLALAREDGRTGEEDAIMAELTALGITELILNALRVRRDRCAGKCPKPLQEFLIRLGPQAVRVFRQCNTGEVFESWHEEMVVR